MESNTVENARDIQIGEEKDKEKVKGLKMKLVK